MVVDQEFLGYTVVVVSIVLSGFDDFLPLFFLRPQQELISQAGLDPVLDASHEERVRQYSKVSLQGELLERGWCSLVPQLLESTEHDYREKVFT